MRPSTEPADQPGSQRRRQHALEILERRAPKVPRDAGGPRGLQGVSAPSRRTPAGARTMGDPTVGPELCFRRGLEARDDSGDGSGLTSSVAPLIQPSMALEPFFGLAGRAGKEGPASSRDHARSTRHSTAFPVARAARSYPPLIGGRENSRAARVSSTPSVACRLALARSHQPRHGSP